ncbi:MAG: hypothetical protein H6816_00270 [Phycisphaerales bacterium]|nr:hypothetical protein [Phycisphaerales bacterium]
MPNRRWRAGVVKSAGTILPVHILLIVLPLATSAATHAQIVEVPMARSAADIPTAVVVRGPWGDAPGQFGKNDEASRPGPMDFVAIGGRLYVLDPVNARVQVFRNDGSFERQVAIGTHTADFLAVERNGDMVVMDAFVKRQIIVFSTDGKPHTRCGIPAAIQLPSAIFLDGERILIEDRHDRVFELALPTGGRADTASTVRAFAGRPDAAGTGVRHARKANGHDVALHAPLSPSADDPITLRFPREVQSIVALESDDSGRSYLAVTCPTAGSADEWRTDIVVIVIASDGTVVSTLQMPNHYVTDHYRKLAVSESGDIIQMQTTEDEVRFVRWTVQPESGKGGAQ